MIPGSSGLESTDFCPTRNGSILGMSLDLEAHVNRMHFKSAKKIREHCWNEASLYKKQIRIMKMKPLEANSRLLSKKFDSASKQLNTRSVKNKSMEGI